MDAKKIISGDKAKLYPMSRVDAAWLKLDRPDNLMIISAVLFLETPVEWPAFKTIIKERLVDRYSAFRIRPVQSPVMMRKLYWQEAVDFKIEDHLHRVRLENGQGDEALQALISKEMSTTLDNDKPLWKFVFVENYLSGPALMIRVHHSIADGFALINILMNIVDKDSSEHIKSAPFAVPKPMRKKSQKRNAQKALVENISSFFKISSQLTGSLKTLLFSRADKKSILRNPLTLTKHVAWTKPIQLADIKELATKSNATINDVAVSFITGALHKFMKSHNAVVNQIRTAIPVNLRTSYEPHEIGNKFGLFYLPLPVGETSAKERLLFIRNKMQQLKKSTDAIMSKFLLQCIGLIPKKLEHKLIGIFSKKVSAVMSNVPGPRHTIYLAGSKISNFVFWPPKTGDVGLAFSILSYDNKITIGLSADRKIIPNPQEIIATIMDEFTEMQRLYT